MPVVGLNLNAVNGELKEKTPKGEINVNSTPKITNVDRKELNLPGIKDVLSIGFEFETRYEPNIAKIKFEGEVLYQTGDAKNIVSKWKKDKKLDDDLTVEILNAIFRKCLSQAVIIANELRLPPPVSFPVVKKKEDEEGYVG